MKGFETMTALANTPIGRIVQNAVAGAIQQGTRTTLEQEHVPIDNNAAPAVARETAEKIAPTVATRAIEAIAGDPVLGPAMNAEPLTQSGNFWLGLAGVLSSLGGMVGLFAAHDYNPMSYIALFATLSASAGVVWRRVTLGAKVQARLGNVTP